MHVLHLEIVVERYISARKVALRHCPPHNIDVVRMSAGVSEMSRQKLEGMAGAAFTSQVEASHGLNVFEPGDLNTSWDLSEPKSERTRKS